MKNIIILQHISIETPGYIKDLMIKDGLNLTTIELDEGDKIPDNLDKYDAMFCMGGPMDTWMEDKYPWLIEEKNKIKNFVLELKKPFLGFCLGCQLLGEIIGGNVVRSINPEIGILDVSMHKERIQDNLFFKFPDQIKVLQWHSYEVKNLENIKDVTLLASSNTTKYQIFRYGNHAYGIQFHIEIKDTTVNEWSCVKEYKNALELSLGENALSRFNEQASNNIDEFNKYSSMLYNNFIKLS